MDIKEYKAKSNEYGSISLIDHSIAVFNLGKYLFKHILRDDIIWQATTARPYTTEDFIEDSDIILSHHDIGKISNRFQDLINKSNSNEPIDEWPLKHNVLSWAISTCTKLTKYESDSELAQSVILHHHTIDNEHYNLSCDEILNSGEYFGKDEIEKLYEFSKEIEKRTGVPVEYNGSWGSATTVGNVPLYKKIYNTNYDSLDKLIKQQLWRAVLLWADRTASEQFENIDKLINNDTEFMESLIRDLSFTKSASKARQIDYYSIKEYDHDRLKVQDEILNELLKNDNSKLIAETGFGKTLIGFRWWAQSDKRLMWITPTRSIAFSCYNSFETILKNTKLTKDVSLGLLVGGEYVEGDCNSDIIISVIDNFLNYNIKNASAHLLANALYCDVVFDEFQDYVSNEAMFSSFIGMCCARTKCTKSRTLLLSATPPTYDFIQNINTVRAGVYNKTKQIRIEVCDINKITDINVVEDSMLITHTIEQARKFCHYYSNYDKTICIHTFFPDDYKYRLLNETLENRGPNNSENLKTLFGTNILGTGCNISVSSVYEMVVSPERTIQSMGRGDRFTTNGGYMTYVAVILNDKSTENIIKNMYGGSDYGLEIFKKWVNTLRQYNGQTITNEQLYSILDKFLNDNKGLYRAYYSEMLLKSSSSYSEMRPKKSYKGKKKDKKNILSSGNSFRGESNNIWVTARVKGKDEILCDQIQIPIDKIPDREFESGPTQERIKYYKSIVPKKLHYKYSLDNKHYKEQSNPENWYRISKNKEYPLLLTTLIFDEKLGLGVNFN